MNEKKIIDDKPIITKEQWEEALSLINDGKKNEAYKIIDYLFSLEEDYERNQKTKSES